MGKYFGTDGIRGVANDLLTPEWAYRLGRCGGHVLLRDRVAGVRPTVMIGRDTRLSGPMLECALVSGLLSIGANVVRLGVVTTPAVAYLTRVMGVDAGVMISASHNPMEDNGIKFFGRDGYKLCDDTEQQIEQLLDATVDLLPRPTGKELGTVRDDIDAKWAYARYMQQCVPIRFDGVRLVMDCAHGAAYELAPEIFRQLGAEVIVVGHEPDGCNINDGCGSTSLAFVRHATMQHQAQLGIAFDGDADRMLAVDERGEVVDGDHLLCIFGQTMREAGVLRNNTIVTTIMANLGFFDACEMQGLHTIKTAVGDRYVVEAMKAKGCNLGGEQSGHIVFLDDNTTGDGILTALRLVVAMVESRQPLSTLRARMNKYPQILINVPVVDKGAWRHHPQIMDTLRHVEQSLGSQGRVLVRESGTESIVRVMVEGADATEIEAFAQQIVDVMRRELGEERLEAKSL